jgi:hypothetical protein
MGMFDTVSWADPLPFSEEMIAHGLNKNNWSFQTKDFDCSMDNYVVQGNQLFLVKYRDEKWIEGDPKAKNLMDRLGYMDRTGEYLDPVKPQPFESMTSYRNPSTIVYLSLAMIIGSSSR